jgi:hypothetical protein
MTDRSPRPSSQRMARCAPLPPPPEPIDFASLPPRAPEDRWPYPKPAIVERVFMTSRAPTIERSAASC